MFGSNTVQSSWANPQQNQQQTPQQGTSAFAQPNAFGTGAFGSTGTFGQPQQPQANPMFGNLGNSSTGTSAFGTFGQNAQQPAAGTSAFGAPKPATGFGAFGATTTSGFGSGGATFGSTPATGATGGGMFGSNTNTGATNAFSNFGGQNRTTTTFGVTSPTAGNETTGPVAPVTTGTSNPPYSAFAEKEPNSNITLQYQTISATPIYRGTSLEELRYQDYQQGRKTAGAFGQTSFGATQPTNPFAGTSTQPASTSIFGGGGTGTGTNVFGTTGTTGTTGTGFGGFGQTQPTQPSTTGTGMFGSAFGQPQQPQQQQQQQQQQQPAGFGGFGQPQQQPATGTGIFGQQNKPATGFGTGGTFGSTTGGAFGSTGAFGQPTSQPAAGTTSIFGQPQQQQQQQPATGNTFGGFASNTAAKPVFGQPAQSTTQPPASFGIFGNQQPQQPQQQQPQQPQAGNLFGNTGGNMFGQPQPQQQQPQQPQQTGLFNTAQPQNNLFGGGTTAGGGLFGNNQQPNQQAAQTTGLFGTKPTGTTTGGGLFGGFGQTGTGTSGTQPQGSIFGQAAGQTQSQQPAAGTNGFGSSMFAPKPPASGLGTSTGGGFGTSLFGPGQSSTLNNSAAPGAQGNMTASISEPLSQNLPIFQMLPPGPRAVDLDQQPKKKPGFFVDVPTRSPVPRIQLSYTPANSKLRGFATSTSGAALGVSTSPFASSLTNGKVNALALSRLDGKGPDGLLGRSSSPSLGSGGRQSVKKLILDKKVEPADLFSQSSSRASPHKVTFSPALSQAAREKEVAREKEGAAGATPAPPVETPMPVARKAPGRFTAQSTLNVLGSQPSSPSKEASAPKTLEHGSYWVKPDLPTLVNLGYEDLSAFKDLVVGRVGYGEIHFMESVDLTNLPRLGALLGEIVKFDDKECSVYPDTDDADKPAPGSGLNVRARIILVRCWATDKATREPIKNERDPGAVKHLKRLKAMKDTHFESFDIQEGKWTFTVDHF